MMPRTWFRTAASGYLQVVHGVGSDQLDKPGLGDWDVRSLLGHATRAFQTIETYLAADQAEVALHAPEEYFVVSRVELADAAAVTNRGRDAGAALGSSPASTIDQIAQRVLELVAGTPDDAIASTPVGGITLIDYLPTRAFELTVHGIDLARATGQTIPADLVQAAVPAIGLAARIAEPRRQIDLLLAATGRQPLAEGFTVL